MTSKQETAIVDTAMEYAQRCYRMGDGCVQEIYTGQVARTNAEGETIQDDVACEYNRMLIHEVRNTHLCSCGSCKYCRDCMRKDGMID